MEAPQSGGGDDLELLSWATEYLSVNIHTYDAPVPHHSRRWTHRKPHWAETDGALSTTEYHYTNQKAVSTGLIKPLYFRHPTRLDVVYSRELLSHYIGHHPVPLEGILTGKWYFNYPDVSDLELSQVGDLSMALDRYRFNATNRECEVLKHDLWSRDLLRRYILCWGSFLRTELDHATVDDLNTVIKESSVSPEAMEGCGLTQAEVATNTPSPFHVHGDLFLGFAWRYGPLLARSWRD
jgi:hypothetical protein